MNHPSVTTACIGLRAKTARAIAVVLTGTAASPRAVIRTEITLALPANPALYQPYHEVMDLPWAHAAEGVLFRHVLQVGAEANDLPSAIHSERGIEAAAAASLGVSLGDLRARLAEIGRILGTPWRADEKTAAMAAWIGLAGVKRSNRKSTVGGEKT
jgi:hypothetical protein